MNISNPFLNRNFHQGFYSVLYIVTSPQAQLLLYQVLKFRHAWYNLGLFHLLVILYLPSMIVAFVTAYVQVQEKYHNYQRSPFFLSLGQVFSLGALTAVQICFEYLALTLNTARDIQK